MLTLVGMKKLPDYRIGQKVHVLQFDVFDAVRHLLSSVCQQELQRTKSIIRTKSWLLRCTQTRVGTLKNSKSFRICVTGLSMQRMTRMLRKQRLRRRRKMPMKAKKSKGNGL